MVSPFAGPLALCGPPRQPRQMLAKQTYDGHKSIHDGATAADLGLRAGPGRAGPGRAERGAHAFQPVRPAAGVPVGQRLVRDGLPACAQPDHGGGGRTGARLGAAAGRGRHLHPDLGREGRRHNRILDGEAHPWVGEMILNSATLKASYARHDAGARALGKPLGQPP